MNATTPAASAPAKKSASKAPNAPPETNASAALCVVDSAASVIASTLTTNSSRAAPYPAATSPRVTRPGRPSGKRAKKSTSAAGSNSAAPLYTISSPTRTGDPSASHAAEAAGRGASMTAAESAKRVNASVSRSRLRAQMETATAKNGKARSTPRRPRVRSSAEARVPVIHAVHWRRPVVM